jgi:hypothetical protein
MSLKSAKYPCVSSLRGSRGRRQPLPWGRGGAGAVEVGREDPTEIQVHRLKRSLLRPWGKA